MESVKKEAKERITEFFYPPVLARFGQRDDCTAGRAVTVKVSAVTITHTHTRAHTHTHTKETLYVYAKALAAYESPSYG